MTERYIYHVCKLEEWDVAQELGRYSGSSQDKADGFIHFSGCAQVHGSVAKHRAGQDGLVLLEVDSTSLGEALKWEPSRGGGTFPAFIQRFTVNCCYKNGGIGSYGGWNT